MKNAFKQIPEPLQKQILFRLGGATKILLPRLHLYDTLHK